MPQLPATKAEDPVEQLFRYLSPHRGRPVHEGREYPPGLFEVGGLTACFMVSTIVEMWKGGSM